jgi:hypothetical protein
MRNFIRSLLSGFMVGLSRFMVGLVAGLAMLPGALAIWTAYFYLGDWPDGNPFNQVFWGTIFGVASWIVVSIAWSGGADIRNADPAMYTELVFRCKEVEVKVDSLKATLDDASAAEAEPKLRSGQFTIAVTELLGLMSRVSAAAVIPGEDARVQELRLRALREARELLDDLRETLASGRRGPRLQWFGGSGYISVWRELHAAEEALLTAEPAELLYVEALDVEARLANTKVDGAEALLGALRTFLGDPKKRRPRAEVVGDLNRAEGRVLLRKIRSVLNTYRDDIFQRFVRIRNGMFATLVYVGLVAVAMLDLAVLALPRTLEDTVAAGMAYYLVGALVGLFAELYGASRRQRGTVHDYGVALARLLTIPVLSGIAAVLGVVVTRLAGASPADVALREIFSLADYPFGIVVAAIFGLTPGLLLERLRAETDEYKEELAKSAPGTPGVTPAPRT